MNCTQGWMIILYLVYWFSRKHPVFPSPLLTLIFFPIKHYTQYITSSAHTILLLLFLCLRNKILSLEWIKWKLSPGKHLTGSCWRRKRCLHWSSSWQNIYFLISSYIFKFTRFQGSCLMQFCTNYVMKTNTTWHCKELMEKYTTNFLCLQWYLPALRLILTCKKEV